MRRIDWQAIAVLGALGFCVAMFALGIYVEYVKFLAYWRIAFG